MSTRTVRLDGETERALQEIQAATGMPITSAAQQAIFRNRSGFPRRRMSTFPMISCRLFLFRRGRNGVEYAPTERAA